MPQLVCIDMKTDKNNTILSCLEYNELRFGRKLIYLVLYYPSVKNTGKQVAGHAEPSTPKIRPAPWQALFRRARPAHCKILDRNR